MFFKDSIDNLIMSVPRRLETVRNAEGPILSTGYDPR